MSAHIISREQEKKLRKLSNRLKPFGLAYIAKMLWVPALKGIPGNVTITAAKWNDFSRLVRMVKRIVPEYRGELKEKGYGWHYLDRTPYYYGEFFYLLNENA